MYECTIHKTVFAVIILHKTKQHLRLIQMFSGPSCIHQTLVGGTEAPLWPHSPGKKVDSVSPKSGKGRGCESDALLLCLLLQNTVFYSSLISTRWHSSQHHRFPHWWSSHGNESGSIHARHRSAPRFPALLWRARTHLDDAAAAGWGMLMRWQ